MSRTLVPITVESHLEQFLYETFSGEEQEYKGETVKVVKIHTSSVLGRYARMMVVKIAEPPALENCNFFLSIRNIEDSRSAKAYHYACGNKTFFRIPEEFNRDLNDLIHNMFETAFFYYVEGYREQGYAGAMRDGIRSFIDKYDLYEHGYSFAGLEQIYARAKRNKPLTKFVNKRK